MQSAEINLTYFDEIDSKSVEWLWYPYIPYGKITIIQGDPGEGKTSLILSIIYALFKLSKKKNVLLLNFFCKNTKKVW